MYFVQKSLHDNFNDWSWVETNLSNEGSRVGMLSRSVCSSKLSHCIKKPTKCMGENKGADQLRGNRKADQHLCFRCMDSRILLLLKSQISSFYSASVTVQAGLCQTWSETQIIGFVTQSLTCKLGIDTLYTRGLLQPNSYSTD